MRRGQPTALFAFTVAVAVMRFFAYGGMPLAQELSWAAILHFVALHAMAFSFAVLVVAALSRATVARAAQVALYAQGVLFLAPFVDVGLGLQLPAYDGTYTGILGGSPGSAVASLAYGLLLAWATLEASVGSRTARTVVASAAAVLGVVGLSLAAVPWPLLGLPPLHWGAHVTLAIYFGFLAALFLHAGIRFASRELHRQMWREAQPWATVGFALFPLVGIAAAGRLALPPEATEPVLRFGIEAPYMLAAATVGAILFLQWRLVRSRAWEPFHREAAVVAKLGALALAATLGLGPFLVAGLAASLMWLARTRWSPLIFGSTAGLAVLVGDLTAVAVDFTSLPFGPIRLLIPINQTAGLSTWGLGAAAIVAAAVSLGSWLTSRTSASGTGPASS